MISAVRHWINEKYEPLDKGDHGKSARIPEIPKLRHDLPTYTKSEVLLKNSKETGIWVTYENAVYDITDYVKDHPGGEQITKAAGRSVESFWRLYQQHHSKSVMDIAEKYRVGNLRQELDFGGKWTPAPPVEADAYSNEPERDSKMLDNSVKPYCAEPPGNVLIKEFYTPNDVFYIRNHHPVPLIDAQTFRLEVEVEGSGRGKILMSLSELKARFEPMEVSCVLQCVGNRRTAFNKIRMTSFAQYENYAIGCARWRGAKLRDVLMHAGLDKDFRRQGIIRIRFLIFEALDNGPNNAAPFNVSIPIEKAMDSNGDCLLAYEMNGQRIPRDHGYPVRGVVPGMVGFRSCKWVGKVRATKTDTDGIWQHSFYKVTPPTPEVESFDFTKIPEIHIWPVHCVICSPMNEQTAPKGSRKVKVCGVAMSGMGLGILRVDVSADKGETWQQAELEQLDQPMFRRWAWTRWEVDMTLPDLQPGSVVEFRSKAVDDAYNGQPERLEDIWNLRGCLNNTQHRVTLTLE